jgi:hypothetical protein
MANHGISYSGIEQTLNVIQKLGAEIQEEM